VPSDIRRAMLLREVEYARPASVEQAIQLLSDHPEGRALAGGQTMINVMKARIASPRVLVDLNGLEELRRIARTPGGDLEVGATATYTQLATSADVAEARPILREVALRIADVQVRNRGTIGGNACLNDPTSHFPPLLVALDATMTIVGASGERTVAAEDFFLGVYMTAVGPGELLTRITVPEAEGAGDGFASLAVGRDAMAIVNVAATVNGGARIAIGCVGAVPERAREMEARLRQGDFGERAVREAAAGIGAVLDPPSDVHGSADYRRHLAEVLAVRAVLEAAERRRG
jgi:carbon-monoxide dehydrogenase medium subunit